MVYGWILKYVLVPVLALSGGLFYKYFKKLPQDNVIEEAIEEVIKEKFGTDIDLSPNTPEDNDGNK